MEIKVLARRGMGVREIARQTGISRNTVRRYLWANVVVPEWWAGRLSNVKRRRRLQDGCSHLGLRRRFAYAARSASKGVPLEERGAVIERSRWKVLGRRGSRRIMRKAAPKGTSKRLRPITLTLVLTVSITLVATGIYGLLEIALLKPAKADGARDFVKTYAAVTGHIPYQYTPSGVSHVTLRTWACEGRSMLSQYRSVTLADPDAPGSLREPFYLLQGFGSTFVLLMSTTSYSPSRRMAKRQDLSLQDHRRPKEPSAI